MLESTSLCFYAGFCVCHRKSLRLFVGKLMAALRPVFANHKGHTPFLCKCLDSNLVVLRVVDSANRQELWVHIAHTNLNTWHAAAMPLLIDAERQPQATALGRIAVRLLTDLPFLGLCTWWELFKDWDFALGCSFAVYHWTISPVRTSVFRPAEMTIEATYPAV